MKTLSNTETAAFQSMLNRAIGAGLSQDGEWGPKTQAAFERWAGISPAKVIPVDPKASNSARLYAVALPFLGMREVPGSASNPVISAAIKDAASWLDSDDSKTAWCGCIMGAWCKQAGLPVPSEYFRAASWLSIGSAVHLADAVKGDIVILSRSGGSHVALFNSVSGDKVRLLGGNQSDAVTLADFKTSTIKGIRRL